MRILTSISTPLLFQDFRLISQVAESLWEVKNKRICSLEEVSALPIPLYLFYGIRKGIRKKNIDEFALSLFDQDIGKYKNKLVANSRAAIEKAKLASKRGGRVAVA